jgi:hypothetical protein
MAALSKHFDFIREFWLQKATAQAIHKYSQENRFPLTSWLESGCHSISHLEQRVRMEAPRLLLGNRIPVGDPED